jgi:transcriptional regulator with XRE-family HTH domain
MAELRLYRTYRFIEKDPVIDRVRTIVQDEGLYKNLTAVHEISGVSATTLHNWFHGDTRRPQHSTIAAVLSSLGYEEQFVKARDIDIEAERKAGLKWLEQANAKRDHATRDHATRDRGKDRAVKKKKL